MFPILSKLLKKHICDHMCDVLEENASRPDSPNSTPPRLPSFSNKNRAFGVVFVDTKKAFDVMEHGLLRTRLNVCEVRQNEIDLQRNYMSGRR